MTKQNENNDFIYVTFIKTTLDRLWDFLTNPVFTKEYWFGISVTSDRKKGSPITYVCDGVTLMAGEVLVAKKTEVLSNTFHDELNEAKSEPPTRVELKIEQDPRGDFVKLTVTHTDFVENSLHRSSISKGWPAVLSGLETFLETGKALPM